MITSSLLWTILNVEPNADRFAILPGRVEQRLKLDAFVTPAEDVLDAASEGPHFYLLLRTSESDSMKAIDLTTKRVKKYTLDSGYKWNSKIFPREGRIAALSYSKTKAEHRLTELDFQTDSLGNFKYSMPWSKLDEKINDARRKHILAALRAFDWFPKIFIGGVDPLDSKGLLETGSYNFLPLDEYTVWFDQDRGLLLVSDFGMEVPIIGQRSQSRAWQAMNFVENLRNSLKSRYSVKSYIRDGLFDGESWYLNYRNGDVDTVVCFGK